MLKRVEVSEVSLGMFIHKLEGSWLKHPFWRTKFLLDDPEDLEILRDSEVTGVLIDISKGRDVAKPGESAPPPASPAASPAIARPKEPAAARGLRPARFTPPASAFDPAASAKRRMAREFGNASAAAKKSQKFISKAFLEARLGKTIDSGQVEPLIEDIFGSVQRNPHAFNGLMRCKRDIEGVYRHALSMSALMISLGRQMKLSPAAIREAGMAGLLKDVGVALLPEEGPAPEPDFANSQAKDERCQHVILGHDYLKQGGDIPEGVLEACLHHHERMDGTGQPFGLRGDSTSIMSRMAAICDVYDDLVSGSPSRKPMDPASALQTMSAMEDKFDRTIFQRFVEAMGVYPIGSVVRLRSDRLALVIDQDPADHTLPFIRVFYSIALQKMVKQQDILLSQCFGRDEIVGVGEPEAYGIKDFDQLREKIFTAGLKATALN